MKMWLFGVFLLCFGCSGTLKTKQLKLAKNGLIDQPRLDYLEGFVAATFQIEVQNRGSTYRFPAQIEMDKEGVVFIGLTPVGTRAFTLRLEDDQVTYEKIPFFKLPLAPDKLLLAFLLTVMPPDTRETHLKEFGFHTQQQANHWDIVLGSTPVVRMFPNNSEVTFQHLQQGYWVTMKQLQWETFSEE